MTDDSLPLITVKLPEGHADYATARRIMWDWILGAWVPIQWDSDYKESNDLLT